MLARNGIKSIYIFNLARGLSNCTTLNCSNEISIKQGYRILDVKKATKRKTKKKRIIIKRVPDDIEAIWLENLTSDNLKLFRKTSFGSYRKINLESLFDKLKEIYPSTFGNVNPVANATAEKTDPPPATPKPEPVSDDVKGSPCLSEYLINHIMEFPLLKVENPLFKFAEEEAEQLGAIDAVMFPSVTRILNDTMSYEARIRLKTWKERMIAELGQEGFYKYQEDLLTQGSKFHSTIKTYLEVADKNLVTVDPTIEGCWKSLERLLPDISDVQFVEESLYHPFLMYKGIVDCVASYRGIPCVIEWKKSSKSKSSLLSTYDAPLQLCAYLGALVWHKNVSIANGLIVVAYTDGRPANVFELSQAKCELYWSEWLRRVQSYWLRKSTFVENEAKL